MPKEKESNAGFDGMFDKSINSQTTEDNSTEPITGNTETSEGVTPEIPQEEIEELWEDGHPEEDKRTQSNEEKRYQYWQSQHDKLKAEYEALQKKLQEIEPYAPVANFLKENPQTLDLLANTLEGQTAAPQAPTQKDVSAELEKPKPPEKPVDYDPEEANIRGTDSWRYKQEKEKYQEALLEYYDKKEAMREKLIEQRLAEERARIEQQTALMQLNQRLATEFNMSPAEIQDFQRMMTNPQTDLKDYVEFYRFKHGRKNSPENAINQFAQTQQKLSVPPPLGIQTGQAPPNYTEEDMFNLTALKEWKNPNRGY